jgi:hypothetical protein
MINGLNSFLENQVCILDLIFSVFRETLNREKNRLQQKSKKNISHQQHLPKSGGSMVKSSFVLLSKFVLD